MRLPSASSHQRVAICPGSAVLPQVQSTGEAAVKGTAIHRFLEDVPRVGREEALAEVPEEYRAACEVIDLDALPLDASTMAQEITYAFDLETGRARELGRSLERDYSGARPYEVVGTADAVGLSADGQTAVVVDWKTGVTELAKAAVNAQMRFLGLAASRCHGTTSARVALVHIPASGLPWFDCATFDAFDLAEIAGDLRRMADRIAFAAAAVARGEAPLLTTGGHCRWCPSLAYCPAQTALVRTVVGELEAGNELAGHLTPATAASAWERVKSIEAAVKRAKAALYTFAAGSAIPLANGLVLGPVESTREEVVGDVAVRVLGDMHGDEVAKAACDWSTSKAAIKRALRGVAESTGAKITHLERDALAAIRAAGGITRNTTTSIKEHVPDNRAAVAVAHEVAALAADLENAHGCSEHRRTGRGVRRLHRRHRLALR